MIEADSRIPNMRVNSVWSREGRAEAKEDESESEGKYLHEEPGVYLHRTLKRSSLRGADKLQVAESKPFSDLVRGPVVVIHQQYVKDDQAEEWGLVLESELDEEMQVHEA